MHSLIDIHPLLCNYINIVLILSIVKFIVATDVEFFLMLLFYSVHLKLSFLLCILKRHVNHYHCNDLLYIFLNVNFISNVLFY